MSTAGPLGHVRVRNLGQGGSAAACARILEQLGATVQPGSAVLAPAPTRDDDLVIFDERPHAPGGGVPSATQPGPGQVHVSVTPFGLDGPYASREDAEAATLGFGGAVADALAGAHAAVAGLGALRAARRERCGLTVEVSTFEVMATCLGELVPRAACADQPERHASGSSADGRVTVLPCADGYVGIAASTAVDRAHLAVLAGLDGDRAELHEVPLETLVGPWLRNRTRREAVEAAQLWRIPVVPVLDEHEARWDEESVARQVWNRPGAAGSRARSPFRITPGAMRQPDVDTPRTANVATSPLGDARVLDLGMVWAGPYCGRLLAGLGAQVVKVEGPTRRDGTRPPDGWHGCAGAFGDLNRGKASLVLDLSSAAGRAVFLELAMASDVVIENFSPRVMPNFGLGYASLAAVQPSLLMLAMPAFGSDGPWAQYVAYGSGLELATGLAASGPGGRPTPAPVPYLDYLSGAYGAAAILAALLARDRSGQGASVEVAQREVACQVLGALPTRHSRQAVPTPDAAALRRDPHLAARGLFAGTAAGPACPHYARLPWRLHELGDRGTESPAPGFGADNRRILRDVAGLTPERIERLVGDSVVGVPEAGLAPVGG